MKNSVVYNAVRCNYCNSVIESTHRHDYKTCECGHVSVDGGKDYKKRLWRSTLELPGTPVQDWTELDELPKPEIK